MPSGPSIASTISTRLIAAASRANWRRINDVVADALRGVTLAQMQAPPRSARKGIPARLAPA